MTDAWVSMQALQQLNPPMMHRDLKPSNIMLDSQGNPKIADLGLAREHLVTAKDTLTAETGTYTYMVSLLRDLLHYKTALGLSVRLGGRPALPSSHGTPFLLPFLSPRPQLCAIRSSRISSDRRSVSYDGRNKFILQSPEMTKAQPYGPATDVFRWGSKREATRWVIFSNHPLNATISFGM